eukprot:snap_masked-scaffold161_size295871-processed-gene-1.3 protein:Tk05109 transcript:snap_masked-scaffold161_size295871-processed-gene-1.3-mRNA-1 annotation:"gtp-binding protein 1"
MASLLESVGAMGVSVPEEVLHAQETRPDYTLIAAHTALISPNEAQFDLIIQRIKDLMEEGRGETIYDVGVPLTDCGDGKMADRGLGDEEFAASEATLQSVAATLDSECVQLRSKVCEENNEKRTGQFLIRKRYDEKDFMEIRIAVVGNVDAGKSTLLGVLTHGELDNGRGFARQKLFRHKHEAESGRTSSVGNDILGFDCSGKVVNKPDHGNLDWVRVCEKSAKVITFIDLAGHEKYLKTTVFGMTGHAPDFGMLMVGANAGIVGMTKEHLGLALALSVPVFVVVTKIDMCPPNVLQETLKLLVRILKSQGCRKFPVMVKSQDDVVLSATKFVSERLCPIFQLRFAAHLWCDLSGNALIADPLGHFNPIAVKSIHRKRMPVVEVKSGQTASFALKKIKRSQIRKGMVMVDPKLNPQSCWEFKGEILVLHHPTTIATRYQAMVHCGSIRQTASITGMDAQCLRTGDKALVHFRFVKHPEYLKQNQRLVFREGRTKAVGNVVSVVPHAPAGQSNLPKHKPNKMARNDQRNRGMAKAQEIAAK